jgi:hypothetical protein
VSKLRENNKTVIGVGVKQSTSDLLVSNCDEFIFYDDLVRKDESNRRTRGKPQRKKTTKADTSKSKQDDLIQGAIDLVIETADALADERGDDTLWGSMIKQALKRRRPEFNESFYGVRSFNSLLEEAQARGQLELEPDDAAGYFSKLGQKHGIDDLELATQAVSGHEFFRVHPIEINGQTSFNGLLKWFAAVSTAEQLGACGDVHVEQADPSTGAIKFWTHCSLFSYVEAS